MDYGTLAAKLVADALQNRIPGLNKQVTFRYFVSNGGEYDAVNDTTSPRWKDVKNVTVVASKPTFQDVQNELVLASHIKLIVPCGLLPKEPNNMTDKVILNGALCDIIKVVGTPGDIIYTVFVRQS